MESRRRDAKMLAGPDRGTGNGGINGDEMGLGKTVQMITLVILSALLEDRWREVNDTRDDILFWTKVSQGQNDHLPSNSQLRRQGSPAQKSDARCPKEDTFLLCYPCVKSGLSSLFYYELGPTLLLTPPILVANFRAEWTKFVYPKMASRFNFKTLYNSYDILDTDLRTKLL